MAAIASAFCTEEFTNELDDLLFEVCEDLQLSPYRYIQANDRYKAVATVLEADGSPIGRFRPRIYPQGSMRLGTTVKPVEGPHDLDFVCELSLPYLLVDPLRLLQTVFSYLAILLRGMAGHRTVARGRHAR